MLEWVRKSWQMRALTIGAASVVGALALITRVTNDLPTPSLDVPTATATSSEPSIQESSMSTPMNPTTDEAAIRDVSDRRTAALLAGDVEILDELLADDFTATHITGYEQSKAEWLAQMASGQMQYHGSTEVSWNLAIDGDTAVIESRSWMDATIYGSRRVWPLASTTYLRKRDGRWTIEGSVATTFQQ